MCYPNECARLWGSFRVFFERLVRAAAQSVVGAIVQVAQAIELVSHIRWRVSEHFPFSTLEVRICLCWPPGSIRGGSHGFVRARNRSKEHWRCRHACLAVGSSRGKELVYAEKTSLSKTATARYPGASHGIARTPHESGCPCRRWQGAGSPSQCHVYGRARGRSACAGSSCRQDAEELHPGAPWGSGHGRAFTV